jgi:hypothetical protein
MIKGHRNEKITCEDPSIKQRENAEFLYVCSIGFHSAGKISFAKEGSSLKKSPFLFNVELPYS